MPTRRLFSVSTSSHLLSPRVWALLSVGALSMTHLVACDPGGPSETTTTGQEETAEGDAGKTDPTGASGESSTGSEASSGSDTEDPEGSSSTMQSTEGESSSTSTGATDCLEACPKENWCVQGECVPLSKLQVDVERVTRFERVPETGELEAFDPLQIVFVYTQRWTSQRGIGEILVAEDDQCRAVEAGPVFGAFETVALDAGILTVASEAQRAVAIDTSIVANGDPGFYAELLPDMVPAEIVTVDAVGGADIPSFSARITAPTDIEVLSVDNLSPGAPLTLTWTPSGRETLSLAVYARATEELTPSKFVLCEFPDTGSFTVGPMITAGLAGKENFAGGVVVLEAAESNIAVDPEGTAVEVDVVGKLEVPVFVDYVP